MAGTPTREASSLIELRNVGKSYMAGGGQFAALKDINLVVQRAECVAIVGKSGSGKSTLINLIAGIDNASSGDIVVDGVVVGALSESQLSAWRGRRVGIVFQFFQLLPTLTVAENVLLPMDFCRTFRTALRRPRALALLDRLGIADQANKFPGDLSGGQQQRAAIARALANDPPIVIADEPTGNLDSQTATEVMSLLAALANEGKTVLTVTHEREFSRFFTRTVGLRDGRIESDTAHLASMPAPASQVAPC